MNDAQAEQTDRCILCFPTFRLKISATETVDYLLFIVEVMAADIIV